MRHLWIVAAILWLALGRAAHAEAIIDYTTICAPDKAVFDAFKVDEDGKRVDGKPYTATIGRRKRPYPGGHVKLFRCEVAGHVVRMNFTLAGFGRGECGAVAYGQLSVWYDGAKVVNRRNFSWFEQCRADMHQEPAPPRLSRLIIDDSARMTTCTRTDWSDWDNKTRATCRTTDLSAVTPDLSSPHYRPIRLTASRLVPKLDKSPVCRLAGRQLNRDPLGDVLAPIAELPLSSDGLPGDFAGATATFDVDNDGVADNVGPGIGVHGERTPWLWRSGASGTTYDLAPAMGGWFRQLLNIHNFRFVRIDGRIYILRIEYDEYRDLPAEAAAGFSYMGDKPAPRVTHQLFGLHPNGTFTRLCEWAPRLHPEEFL